MRAVVIVDGELRWESRPDPVPGDTELLVSVRAAGVNAADLMQRRGVYPAPPGWPADIPGMELAGEVVAVGSRVTRFAVGDRVMAIVGGGAQAELAVTDETAAMAVPAATGWAEAGGFPEAYCTAHDALVGQGGLRVGDRVLVTGAAGGVGSAGVQLAVAAGGRVVASVRNADHHRAVEALGAAEVVVPDDVVDRGPYDVVLELIGAASLPASIGALATGGRIVVIGVGGGARFELNLLELMGRRGRISASTLRVRTRAEKADVVGAVDAAVVPLLAAGRVTVPVAATYPMERAEDAYARFAAGAKLGKVVLLNGG